MTTKNNKLIENVMRRFEFMERYDKECANSIANEVVYEKDKEIDSIIAKTGFDSHTMAKKNRELLNEIAELTNRIYLMEQAYSKLDQEHDKLKAENEKLKDRLSCELCSKEVPLEEFMMCEDCYTKTVRPDIERANNNLLDEIIAIIDNAKTFRIAVNSMVSKKYILKEVNKLRNTKSKEGT
jgi:predicted nuclease with TOPRIM domain